MKMAKQITVTDEGLKKLNEQLEYLKTVKRKEVVEAIRVALSFGDLSENSEYDEAKNEQANVEAQISELEETLKHVKLISDSDVTTDSVGVGAKVKVLDMEFDEEIEYTILGSTESDPLENKISDQSPIGKAIIGAKVGDVITVDAPGGELKLKVLEISRQNT
ncbi:MAG: transcription elongation factor GreA [Firmicutes bacterium]|nr:transcription elongation factor GreA [Bacillota bacterium]